MRPIKPGRTAGATLVELVLVITILAVVAGLAAQILPQVVAQQSVQRERLLTATGADAMLSRLRDQWRRALPNSLRVRADSGEVWIEWVPVTDAGRYRSAPDTAAADAGDILDFSSPTDASFDVVGVPLTALEAESTLVINNLGTPESDVYNGNNRRSGLVSSLAGARLSFTAAGAWPMEHPDQRFFIVDRPVSVGCVPDGSGGYKLWYVSRYGWSSTQPGALADPAFASGQKSIWLDQLRDCSASYDAQLQNIGLMRLRIVTGSALAPMPLMIQTAVSNTP